jgi:hypothetical protein
MKVIACFLFFLLLAACQSDEADEPELRTNSVDGIGLNRAVLEGEVVEVGPLKPIQYGFLWSTEAGVTILSATNSLLVGEALERNIEYSVELNELIEDTDYFVRAFAVDPSLSSVYYGNEVSFRTAQPSLYLQTLAPESITTSSALLKGDIIDLNELKTVTYGFAWADQPFTSILEATVLVVGETEIALSYQANLSGLVPSTTYYFRAFISNNSGTVIVYGNQKTLTTVN